MKNRAHQESKEERLTRLKNNSPHEAIGTLLNSIDSFFNNEIKITPDNYQTSLLFLGIHAVALTISEAFFNKSGEEGYRMFLEKYVDGEDEDKKFSKISRYIHDWRNILAHQWIGSLGHSIVYDYEMEYGWKLENDLVRINPKIYCEHYLRAFDMHGRIWNYASDFSDPELKEISIRIIKKYEQK